MPLVIHVRFSFKIRDSNHVISCLYRLKDNQVIPQTGMVILDIGMLSGFSLYSGAALPTDLIKKVEILPEKVILYLDSVSVHNVILFMFRREKVGWATL